MQKTNKKYVFRILILSSLLVWMLSSLSIASVTAASDVELYYDDGDAEIGYFWETAAAGMFLVRFTPPTSGQLVECSFYITNNPATIMVSVFDLEDNEIEPFSVTPASTGWSKVNLATYGMTVSADVDFYIAIMTTIDGVPSLGADTSDPDGRSWIFYGDSEELVEYTDGDFMIRAVIRTSVYLTVDSPYGTPDGEDWYDPDTNAYATLDTDIVDHGNGTRRVFTHWSGDASGTNYAQSDAINMDENKTAIANWKTQYYLTMSTDFGTVTPVSGWYDAGSSVQIGATAPTPTSNERYTWLGWTGTGSGSYSSTNNPASITMNEPITQTAAWKQKFPVDIQITLSSEKITIDETIAVSGYITPAHETIITLTYKRPDGSVTNKTVTSEPDGTFSHTYTLNAEGLWSVTASCSEDADYLGDKSETEDIRVEAKESIWAMMEVIIGAVALVVSVIIVGAAWLNSRRKRDNVKELIDQIDDAFFTFKRNSRRCEAELYRLKDIVLEQYKNGTINEANYTILNERIDDYINKLSQP